ncbi:hypothetical protein GCM10010112_24970 [Actinoplanes lobatus]|uniref:Lipoprotein n=1 Tax=Actinoplanes lobatus TaxID=113568 RepID=A0A7W7HJ96_9ACTN|nr:hypothetical protein [Actinoplanes lobatus]MBB4751540.1 hypothetical protein [Actinoplanes lobatus]GGN64593.1 hypothetical protein GCM10010112_24970 [Actinoplanes lobatus]GIE45955.1 hypothetical protein Alo02nite_88530 [Actinoplanes lobatus]
MTKTRTAWTVAALLCGTLLSGCGGALDGSDEDHFQQAMDYAKCLRENGIPNAPDPVREDNGVGMELPKVDDAVLKKAEEACRDKQPQGDAGDSDPVDPAKVTAWATCMRGKLPKFPDPEVEGNTIKIILTGTGIEPDSSQFKDAREACDSQDPGGNTHFEDLD